ncbi:MAG TPA: sulfotransferase [Planctomycetota bacterium]|nr:sulfotransferase [Planctomycetota bacterium]
MRMRIDNLIIVGGCGSSGTTLLVHLLGQHPAIAVGPEMSVFNHPEIADFARLRREWPRWFRRGLPTPGYQQFYRFIGKRKHYRVRSADVRRWVEASEDSAGFFRQLARHVCELQGKTIFAEKTPTNVYAFAEIAKVATDVPLIHVIRDGRDVVCSLRNRGYDLFGAASRWLYDTLAGLRARAMPSYVEIRYEDLVREPVRVLESLFARIGIAFDASPFERAVHSRTDRHPSFAGTVAETRWRQTPADPVSSRSLGRHHEELSAADRAILARVALKPLVREQLGAPAGTFPELLELLGYEGFSAEPVHANGIHPRWIEWRDQYRRARSALRHLRACPPACTFLGTSDGQKHRRARVD